MSAEIKSDKVSLASLGISMEPQEPSNRWIDQKFIITGIPKIGKTTFWAQGGEKTYFFRMAPEFTNLRTFGVSCRDIGDVNRELGKLFKAAQAGILPFETIVFDPAIRLLEFLAADICEDNGVESIGDIGHGKGWSLYKKSIKMFMNRLEALPCAVVLNVHSFTQDFPEMNNDKKTYTKEVVALSGKTEAPVCQWADHVLHVKAGYVGNVYARTMVLQGNKYIEAGTKSKKFKEMKLTQLQWTDNDKLNYDKFRGYFD